MDRHIIMKLSLAQCFASNNNTYRNDSLFKHASQMSARLLKSDLQHILKKMGEFRSIAWISSVRHSAGNENSYLAPEVNYFFSEWVYVNDTDRKYNFSILIVVFETIDMGMVWIFQIVFNEMKLMYKCFYL